MPVRSQSSRSGVIWSSKVHHLDAGTASMLNDIEILVPLTLVQPASIVSKRRGASEPGMPLPNLPGGGPGAWPEDEEDHLAYTAASKLLSGCHSAGTEDLAHSVSRRASLLPDPSSVNNSTPPYLISGLNSHMHQPDYYPSFGHEARSPSPVLGYGWRSHGHEGYDGLVSDGSESSGPGYQRHGHRSTPDPAAKFDAADVEPSSSKPNEHHRWHTFGPFEWRRRDKGWRKSRRPLNVTEASNHAGGSVIEGYGGPAHSSAVNIWLPELHQSKVIPMVGLRQRTSILQHEVRRTHTNYL